MPQAFEPTVTMESHIVLIIDIFLIDCFLTKEKLVL